MINALVAAVEVLALTLASFILIVALSMLTKIVFVILDALHQLKQAEPHAHLKIPEKSGKELSEDEIERTFGFQRTSITLPEHAPEGATDEL